MAPIFEINEYFTKDDCEDQYYKDDLLEDLEEASNIFSDYGFFTFNQKYILHYKIDDWYFFIDRDYEVRHNISKRTDNTFRRNVVSFCEKLNQYFDVYDGIEIELTYS